MGCQAALLAGSAAGAFAAAGLAVGASPTEEVRRACATVRRIALRMRTRARARPPSAAERRRECMEELPVLLDVVTLGLSAGLSFDASLELYCERCPNELARAFSASMLVWRLGVRGREEELLRLADELDMPALSRFAAVVGESLAFGSPLAQALERQGEAIREEQRSQVEEEIERIPVKMLVPLGTLIVPAMLLAILGPLLGSAVAM